MQPVDVEALLAGCEPLLKLRLTHLMASSEPPPSSASDTGGGCILAITLHHAILGEQGMQRW